MTPEPLVAATFVISDWPLMRAQPTVSAGPTLVTTGPGEKRGPANSVPVASRIESVPTLTALLPADTPPSSVSCQCVDASVTPSRGPQRMVSREKWPCISPAIEPVSSSGGPAAGGGGGGGGGGVSVWGDSLAERTSSATASASARGRASGGRSASDTCCAIVRGGTAISTVTSTCCVAGSHGSIASVTFTASVAPSPPGPTTQRCRWRPHSDTPHAFA